MRAKWTPYLVLSTVNSILLTDAGLVGERERERERERESKGERERERRGKNTMVVYIYLYLQKLVLKMEVIIYKQGTLSLLFKKKIHVS